jgi:hypothetical protein
MEFWRGTGVVLAAMDIPQVSWVQQDRGHASDDWSVFAAASAVGVCSFRLVAIFGGGGGLGHGSDLCEWNVGLGDAGGGRGMWLWRESWRC